MAVDIITQLNEELLLALEPTSMFEHPTVAELVEYIISENEGHLLKQQAKMKGMGMLEATLDDRTGSQHQPVPDDAPVDVVNKRSSDLEGGVRRASMRLKHRKSRGRTDL